MTPIARPTVVVVTAIVAALLGACTSQPERADLVVLVNPIYPSDAYDVARPKSQAFPTCDLLTPDEATELVGTPAIPTDVGGPGCNYFGPYGLIGISQSVDQIDQVSYQSSRYGQRANVGGNSAWVQDFGVTDGCAIDVALNTYDVGQTLSLDSNNSITCDELLPVAEIILSRIPDDPTIEPRVIPELDRYRAVVDPNKKEYRAINGQFPPDGWTVTSLDDPAYLHPGNAGPAGR